MLKCLTHHRYTKNFIKIFFSKNQTDLGMDGWSYFLTKFTYKEWQYYWLTKCMNKNHDINGYALHNQPYIARDGCVKCSHLRFGSCSCTLSASNIAIPCLWTLLYQPSIPISVWLKNLMLFMLFLACFDQIKITTQWHPCTWCFVLPHVPTNGIQQLLHLPP